MMWPPVFFVERHYGFSGVLIGTALAQTDSNSYRLIPTIPKQGIRSLAELRDHLEELLH
jgi:hypothetical protein